jgi:SlyX protein
MQDSDPIAERFVVLETKVAYQEHTIFELNQVVVEQSRAIADLTRRLELVDGHLRALDPGRDAAHEKPPHY